MTHDIGLERMIGASPAPASRPVVGRVDGLLAPRHPASLADLVLRYGLGGFLLKDVILLGAALSTAAEALEAAS